MPNNKAETSSQKQKLKTNGTSNQTKLSTSSRNDEVRKSRELSSDRNNVKTSLTAQKSTKKVESSRLKPTETPKTRSNIGSSRTATGITKSSDKLNVSNITPRTTLLKSTSKPVKSLSTSSTSINSSRSGTNINSSRSTTNINSSRSTSLNSSRSSSTVNSSKSITNMPLKGTKSTSRDVTSKRVTKEQYFPKKYPFSSYLHEEEKVKNDIKIKPEQKTVAKSTKKIIEEPSPKKLSRERTLTRTLSPSEVKVIKNIVQEEIVDNRPRTATIRKHYDEKTMKTPDIEIQSEKIEQNGENYEENIDYEDDFDSYESDFETGSSSSSTSSGSIETNSTSSDSSTSSEEMTELTQKRTSSAGNEEERKLDSGNYDLPDMKHKQILDKIKEAVEKENSNLSRDTFSNLASLSDEGFEDGSKNSLVTTGFVNFIDAKKKQQKKKLISKSRKRGDDLMSMIRLNNVSFSLFDMKAISYDEFMQSYGKNGSIQMSSQTGDDDIDEEVQTEIIETVSKSTQFPVRFSKLEDYFPQENVAAENEIIWENYKIKELNKFMETKGRLVLQIMEEKQIKTQQIMKKNDEKLPFSDGYFSLNFDNLPFLKNRSISYMTYSKYSKLLTVHDSNIQVFMDQNNQLLSRSSICVWDVSEPIYPQFILASSGEITKACFDSNHGFLIFTGICDGSVSVWDLRENPELHRKIFDENSDKNHIMRSPTYTTSTIVDGELNSAKIIAIQSYYEKINDNYGEINCQQNTSGIQVATLDETGLIVIWSVIQKQATPELLSEDPGLIPWGCVILVQGLTISLQKLNPNLKELQCFDLQFSEKDFNHLFIASNYGVLHCLTSGMKPKPKIYMAESSVNCVEMAPFSSSHFLSGCENGNIKLHSRFYEKPLMTLCSTEEKNKFDENIEIIEWSNSRPCVFFVKDKSNYLHIWDLAASDMYPIYSIPFSEEISDIKFLSPTNKSTQSSYMAIASKSFGVRIHTVSKEFSQITSEQYKTELNIFLNYANRL